MLLSSCKARGKLSEPKMHKNIRIYITLLSSIVTLCAAHQAHSHEHHHHHEDTPPTNTANAWLLSLTSSAAVSLLSLIGALFVATAINERLLFFLSSLAVGSLLGDTFLHLIPVIFSSHSHSAQPTQVHDHSSDYMYGLTILASFFFCFFLEVILRARHQNEGKSPTHVHHTHTHSHIKAFGWLNLVGDGVHNFMDGIGLAGAFQVSTAMGMATMICICFHEIPQELSDFGVLISAGFSVRQALIFNLLSAGFAVLGCFLGLLLNTGGLTQQLGFIVNEKALVCITAGSFLYIVASMIPELMSHMFSKKRRFRNENSTMNAIICASGIGIGIGLMLFIGFAEHKIIDFFSK